MSHKIITLALEKLVGLKKEQKELRYFSKNNFEEGKRPFNGEKIMDIFPIASTNPQEYLMSTVREDSWVSRWSRETGSRVYHGNTYLVGENLKNGMFARPLWLGAVFPRGD